MRERQAILKSTRSEPGGAKLIDIKGYLHTPLRRGLYSVIAGPLERALAIESINRIYSRVVLDPGSEPNQFFCRALSQLQVSYRLRQEDRARIPVEGPLVMVANHPFGGLEGLITGALLTDARPDFKFMGNYLLKRIPELAPYVIPVDPFGQTGATAANLQGLRAAIRWLKAGHALVVFPAGEVSSAHVQLRRVTDPEWNHHVGALARRCRATCLPAYFHGRNSNLFQAAGLIHPRLRTLLLPHEVMNKAERTIDMVIGQAISPAKCLRFDSDQDFTHYLRMRTYLLAHRLGGGTQAPKRPVRAFGRVRIQRPLIPPIDPVQLQLEVEALPETQKLVERKDIAVYQARASQIPCLLKEIGRLREETFRSAGEGTGNSLDLDRFDPHYVHLFGWHRQRHQVVGAYRLGLADEILGRRGLSGLYTSTLFRYKSAFRAMLESGLELGRSFVSLAYQKRYDTLLLLWQGIGRFIVERPRYRVLFGPVSISREYQTVSRHLMVKFLSKQNRDLRIARWVSPRKAIRGGCDLLNDRLAQAIDLEEISMIISEIEHDGKGVPVLLRHYLKLDAWMAGFNLDRRFTDVIDGLVMVDLTRTDPKRLERFMGLEGARTYLQACTRERLSA